MKLLKKFSDKCPVRKQVNPVNWLSGALGSAQRNAADYLNHKTARWSQQQKKMVLILFCLVAGNYCLYVIGKAILSDNGPPTIIQKMHRMDIPGALPEKQFRNIPLTDSLNNKHH